MLKKVLFFALLSIIAHKIYRYYKFMGYGRPSDELAELEPIACAKRYENLTGSSSNDRRKVLQIFNTLDSDVLPNGICMFSSGANYPFLRFDESRPPKVLLHTAEPRSSLYMLDMNYLDQLKPVAVDIVDSQMQPKDVCAFNLFALSIYQDEEQNFKLVAANFDPTTRSTRIEKFAYDLNRYGETE